MLNKTFELHYQEFRPDELSAPEQALIAQALQWAHKAYAPYSHFGVGAALLLDNGRVIAANNQENEAYPSGLCAERTALFYAGAQGAGMPIRAMAIAARTAGGQTAEPVYPCGACRQVMLEQAKRQGAPFKLYMAGADRVVVVPDVRLLLPFAFTM